MPRMADVRQITIDSVTHQTTTYVDTDLSDKVQPSSVAPAEPGALTTRTSVSVGTITMDPGHTVATAMRVDIYWATGVRTNVLVGTVAVNSVPISGGSGDDLPALSAELTVAQRHAETIAFDGDQVRGIEMYSPVPATITFTQADGTTVINTPVALEADDSFEPKYMSVWRTGQGTSPVAGGAVGKILFSHGEELAQAGLSVVILRD